MNSIQNSYRITGLLSLLLISSQSMANSVGIGIGRASEFPGSDDYQLSPNAAFEISTPLGILKNNQVGVQLDIVQSTTVDTGPVLRANFGRDEDSISDDVIATLDGVSPATELGWFVGSGFRLDRLGIQSDAIVIGRLNAVTDIGDGHSGVQVTGSLGLVMQLTENFRLVPSIGFNYADDNYTDAFYSVNNAGANASGLDEFSASGGLEYTQVALFAVRDIDPRWSVTGTLAYNALQGDAAQSPITKQRGTDQQLFTGFVVNYKF